MKIGVVGCGAVGSYYGARLGRAGAEVHFLLRSDYVAVRERGVRIESPEGDFTIHPHAARTPQEIGRCDLVIVALKTTANGEFRSLLTPMVGPETAVLTLQNGLGNEEALAALLGAEKILGGLCFVCLNRLAPGLVRHLAHGTIVLGEFGRPPNARTQAIAELLRHAGIPCRVAGNLAAAHWEKLVWNIPFNGLGVAGTVGYAAVTTGVMDEQTPRGPCLKTDALLAEPRWEAEVRGLMLEVIAAANGLGLGLAEAIADSQIERTREMGPYQASTLLDFERGLPLELEPLFLEPWRQARAAGVSTPRLAKLCQVLARLDSRRLPTEAR